VIFNREAMNIEIAETTAPPFKVRCRKYQNVS